MRALNCLLNSHSFPRLFETSRMQELFQGWGTRPYIIRDHPVYAPSEWEMALYCNAVSHWRIQRMIPASSRLLISIMQISYNKLTKGEGRKMSLNPVHCMPKIVRVGRSVHVTEPYWWKVNMCCSTYQSGTKPNLVAKIWQPNLVTICAWLPKLVANISSNFHHLVNTGLAVGSFFKWLPITVAHTCKLDTIEWFISRRLEMAPSDCNHL